MHLSQMVYELGCIFHTQVLGLGVKILVNVTVYPAILSCFRSQIDENIADCKER